MLRSVADRYLDITFGLQVIDFHPLFPYFLEKCSGIPTSPFSFTSKLFFCYQRLL